MTTNDANRDILNYSQRNRQVYTARPTKLGAISEELQDIVRRQLQKSQPFTGAFIGRISAVVPFLPMCNDDPEEDLLQGEMMTVAKLLIEREQDKLSGGGELLQVNQELSPSTKHQMATIIADDGAVPEAGVRSIQKRVADQMGKEMLHAQLLESGGIENGSNIIYHASLEDRRIGFRMASSGESEEPSQEEREDDSDLFG